MRIEAMGKCSRVGRCHAGELAIARAHGAALRAAGARRAPLRGSHPRSTRGSAHAESQNWMQGRGFPDSATSARAQGIYPLESLPSRAPMKPRSARRALGERPYEPGDAACAKSCPVRPCRGALRAPAARSAAPKVLQGRGSPDSATGFSPEVNSRFRACRIM